MQKSVRVDFEYLKKSENNLFFCTLIETSLRHTLVSAEWETNIFCFIAFTYNFHIPHFNKHEESFSAFALISLNARRQCQTSEFNIVIYHAIVI